MKKIILLVLVTACCLCLTSCFPMGGASPTPDSSPSAPDTSLDSPKTRVDEFFKRVKDAGLEVTNKTEKEPQLIGASVGKAYQVNGVPVEVYEYDAATLTDAAKPYYDSAKDKGTLEVMPGAGTSKIVFHDDMVLFCDGHPNADILAELFLQV